MIYLVTLLIAVLLYCAINWFRCWVVGCVLLVYIDKHGLPLIDADLDECTTVVLESLRHPLETAKQIKQIKEDGLDR